MAVAERVPTSVRGVAPQTGTLPAGTATGDVVEMLLSCRGGTAAACPTPAGWTAVPGSPYTSGGGTTANDVALFLFRRVYDGVWTMPALSWTGDGTNAGDVFVRAFSGADGVNTEDAAVVVTPGAGVGGGSAVLAEIATVTPGAYVWHALCYGGTSTTLAVPDVTDLALTTNPVTGSGHSGPQAAAGGSGTRTYSWTGGAARNFVGIMVAVRPGAAPTVWALAAGLQGVGVVSADLLARRGLAGALQGVGVVTANLLARRGLAGTLQGVGVMLADLTVVAAPAGAHGPEDYETAIGPLVNVTMLRRASLFVTIGDFPAGVLSPPASTMKGSLYVGQGASQPAVSALFRQADTPTKTARLDTWVGTGPTPPSGNFPAGVPATLATDDGSPLIRSSGIPRLRLTRGSGQSTDSGVDTPVVWTTEDVDSDGMFDPANPDRIVIAYTGQYLVAFSIQWAQAGAGAGIGTRRLQLERSTDGGANYTGLGAFADRRNAIPAGLTPFTNSFASIITATAGYMYRLRALQDSGSVVGINGAALSLVFLGPA